MKLKNMLLILSCFAFLAGCGTSGDETKPQRNKESEQTKSSGKEEKSLSIEEYPQFMAVQQSDKVVVMETNKGSIKIKLFPKFAPKAVKNFVAHSEKGYYNGLSFHRVIKDFMIQGGDPEGNGTGGESIWGKPFEDEFSTKLYNFRGALSMANSGADTNGSQFFIVQNKTIDPGLKDQMEQSGYSKEIIKAYEDNGGTPWLDQKHTVFGQVIEGMETVDKIAEVKADEQGVPAESITIKSIKVIQ
ncbi:peptidyl-prolyl cis-trans isomerase B (cyclophilin B) [Peribacillus deserti]|uniref:Peptidyl-prolyl cis-trans isomerase n=1 Tax=Peribacillus deserti TaxID=673318 RepID=A0ABS2QMK5_9BACI|nr:peptidylprolyl isomerase [Peribacillus deserti]MBM7694412.1 peptidyl-prolyl cis-trans isomerase B (cyclophilin B) [Peribacillus deserti]